MLFSITPRWVLFSSCALFIFSFTAPIKWESKFIKLNKDGSLKYIPDEKGNIIPDFSRVGYYGGDKAIPDVAVVKTISPSENALADIQSAIDELSKAPVDKNGFRGTILLKKGIYKIPGTIKISSSGIVLRGEGDDENSTKIIATSKNKDELIYSSPFTLSIANFYIVNNLL